MRPLPLDSHRQLLQERLSSPCYMAQLKWGAEGACGNGGRSSGTEEARGGRACTGGTYMCWVKCNGQIGTCAWHSAQQETLDTSRTASPTQGEQAAALSRSRQLRSCTPCNYHVVFIMLYNHATAASHRSALYKRPHRSASRERRPPRASSRAAFKVGDQDESTMDCGSGQRSSDCD